MVPEPRQALGRYGSSPWPDRIKIRGYIGEDKGRYVVFGEVEVTSVPGEEQRRKVLLPVERTGDRWWITEAQKQILGLALPEVYRGKGGAGMASKVDTPPWETYNSSDAGKLEGKGGTVSMVEVTKKEEKEKHVFELEVEVTKERVDQVLESIYRDFNFRVTVPGFRKGRVPRAILRARLGKEAFLDELVHRLVPEAAKEVLEKEGIDVVGEPDVEILHVEEGEPLRFRLKVIENPEVLLARPEELEVRKYRLEVRESDIDAYIEELRRRFGQWEEQEGPVVSGDMVIVAVGDKQYTVQAGGEQHPLAQEVLGMRRGERRTVTLEGEEKELEVRTVFRKRLPEVNEEFVKHFGEDYASVEAFREDVRKILEGQAQEMVQERLQEEAVVALCQKSQVYIPEPLLEEETRRVIQLFEGRLRESGTTLERYLELMGYDFATFTEKMRNIARWRLKKHFVLQKYAREYGLEVTEEELHRLVESVAQRTGKPLEKVAERLVRSNALVEAANRLLSSKLVEDLLSRVKIQEIAEPLNFDQWQALGDPEEEMVQG
ncbi:trigger factor [Candidatus Caldatribacterium saccharofermentans]